MIRLLKIINYAAQIMALYDTMKAIKRLATKTNDTGDGQTENNT